MAPPMRASVEALRGEPLPHGLLGGCVPVEEITGDRVHELMGVEWLALGCAPVHTWDDPCDQCDTASPEKAEKTFTRPEVEHACPIHIYASAECGTIGWSYEEASAEVLAALELGQQRAIEEGLWRQLAARAVDLTPDDGPIGIAQGIAALEGCLAESYGGVGTLIVPAGAAALLGCCNLVPFPNPMGCHETLAGNNVLISAGASAVNEGPDGLPAEPGTAWLAITGPMSVRLGPAVVVPPDAGSATDYRYNTLRVLAERTAVVSQTCQVCMVRVDLCGTG